ncbi:DUF5005 domain-containing protein [Fulvivirga sp. M361]|uniref:DUF5005 domain-containing protein n=1 Tax=Fulvivirga sp. M361 TaxID=2594266 RepID=UPI00117A9B3C|nr:DUF5005 domain-containing protein [Fulvivirga sp. M361]TRX59595.1 DUF5005 domain-containing protein [Fulvivirga sp. M361]
MSVHETTWIIPLMLFLSCEKEGRDDVSTPSLVEEEIVICEQSQCWHTDFHVCRDSTYIDLFTRNKGWTGGDATYSVDLKNGQTLWMFGDTFIDQVSEDRSRPSARLVNNTLVLQEGLELKTYHGGTSIRPDAFAKPPESGNWYWPGDATVVNGKLLLFMHGFGTGGQGAWDFFRTSIDLLTLNLETLEIESNDRLFDAPSISWGAAIMEDHHYSYVYGVRSESSDKHLYIARTSADLSDNWEYFTGTEWHTDPTKAHSIFNGVSEQFSLFKEESTYYFLTQQGALGKEINLHTSIAPEGPFQNGRVVYCTPETDGDIFTYNAFAHHHIYQDSLLVSYNVNSFDFSDLFKSADNYRPYFVKVGGWREN